MANLRVSHLQHIFSAELIAKAHSEEFDAHTEKIAHFMFSTPNRPLDQSTASFYQICDITVYVASDKLYLVTLRLHARSRNRASERRILAKLMLEIGAFAVPATWGETAGACPHG